MQDSLDPYGYRRDRMLRQGMVDTRHVGAIGTCCERVRVPRGGSCILIFNIFTRTSLKRGRSCVLSVPLTSGMHQRTESKEKYQTRCIGDGVSPTRIRLPQFRRLQCLSFVGCSASVSSAAVPQFRRLQCLSFVGGHVVALMRPTSALARWHWRAWTAARQRPTPPHPPRSHCRAA